MFKVNFLCFRILMSDSGVPRHSAPPSNKQAISPLFFLSFSFLFLLQVIKKTSWNIFSHTSVPSCCFCCVGFPLRVLRIRRTDLVLSPVCVFHTGGSLPCLPPQNNTCIADECEPRGRTFIIFCSPKTPQRWMRDHLGKKPRRYGRFDLSAS